MYRLVALDLDGTLLNDQKELTESVKETLLRLKARGTTIVISTGRSYQGVQKYLDFLGRQVVDYVISFNGALTYDVQNDKELAKRCLKREQLLRIARVGERIGLPVHFVSDLSVYTPHNPIGKYAMKEAIETNARMVYCPLEDLPGDKNYYKALYSEEQALLEERIRAIPQEFYTKFTVVKSDDSYLEIIREGVSKGVALRGLIHQLGIDAEEVVSIGDQENDIDMIALAGVGVSMGNAIDAVKNIADFITTTNNDNGVVIALEKYFL